MGTDTREIKSLKWSRIVPIAGAVVAALFVAGPAVAQDDAARAGNQVEVTDYGVVEALTVKDTDLAEVLQMLSIQSQKNIITSKNVAGTVTANLFDVTFYEALDAILRANGYGYIEEGNFVYVYTLAEIEEIEKAKRSTVTRIFELDHVSAGDALEFIQPLLSDDGKASARGDVEAGFKPDLSSGGADGYAFSPKIVVNDYAENVEQMGKLLYDLDTPPQQVLVEASILQTTLDESNAFGVDFTLLGSADFTDFTNPLSTVGDLLRGSVLGGFQPDDNRVQTGGTTVGNVGGPGGLKVGIIRDNVAVFLRVLDEVSDTTVLARPKIMALNRQRAQVLVGARVGYLSTTSTETTTTQTVEFLDTGVQIVFRPFIARDGNIRMELSPSVSEASLRTVTDSNSAVVTIPDELTNEITTNVRMKDGETLVLGGLFRESTSINRRQVPLLGDIPIIGAAFRGQDDKVDRDEIIFLITPTIIKDAIMGEVGDAVMAYTETVRVGTRAGLLPFSRESITSNYNQDAIDAFNEGSTEKALYYVNNSLRLAANQPEMIRFRDRITGAKQSRVHERFLMERAFRQELGETYDDDAVFIPEIDNQSAIAVIEADALDWFTEPETEAAATNAPAAPAAPVTVPDGINTAFMGPADPPPNAPPGLSPVTDADIARLTADLPPREFREPMPIEDPIAAVVEIDETPDETVSAEEPFIGTTTPVASATGQFGLGNFMMSRYAMPKAQDSPPGFFATRFGWMWGDGPDDDEFSESTTEVVEVPVDSDDMNE